MSKQRPDPDKMTNELSGASAFFRGASPAPTVKPTADSPTPEEQPINDVTTSPRRDVATSQRHDVTASKETEPQGFDITRETASRDSLRLSIDETKALEAMRSSLKWEHDLSVSKNDICRVAVHWLLEDFRANGERSQAVLRLTPKGTRHHAG